MDSMLAYATQSLLEQPGVAAVEELEIRRRWGRTRSVTACIRVCGDVDARDVCERTAEALAKQLGVVDMCLVTAAATGETVPGEGSL